MKTLNPFFLYLVCVSLLAELALFRTFSGVVSVPDIMSFTAVWAIFLFLVAAIAKYLDLHERPFASALAYAAVTVFAFYDIFLIGTGLALSDQLLEIGTLILLSLLSVFLILALQARVSGPVLMLCVILAAMVTAAIPHWQASSKTAVSQGIRQIQLAQGAIELDVDYSQLVQMVEFETSPNIYLIGLSAAAPGAILRKHLALETSPLNSVLQDFNFRTFRNVFTEAQLTRNSYDTFLSMHRDYFRLLQKIDMGTLASGHIPSPLFDIFRANGYEVNVLSETAKLGIKGRNIDHYEIVETPSICNYHFIANSIKKRGFLGGCVLRKMFNRFYDASTEEIISFHVEKIRALENRTAPQLVFMHLRPPYHYRGDKMDQIDLENVAEFKIQEQEWLEQAATNLGRLMDAIRKSDADSIVLAFGDHGLALAGEPVGDEPSVFFMQDRYGVLGATYPSDVCSEYLPKEGSYDFVTTLQLTRNLVQCLSGGQDPYLVPYTHQSYWNGRTINLEPFVYEE
ncbi:MAG: LTA synthase family protein [Marinosulfonomonas sp.]|nr:LTA synthase family protein [Marinosulfonomonas sp.]